MSRVKTVTCKVCNKSYEVPELISKDFMCCQMPPVTVQAVNFTKSIINHTINNFKKDEDLQKTRLEICKSCDFLQNERCTQCGCSVELKTAWEISKCPISKW